MTFIQYEGDFFSGENSTENFIGIHALSLRADLNFVNLSDANYEMMSKLKLLLIFENIRAFLFDGVSNDVIR